VMRVMCVAVLRTVMNEDFCYPMLAEAEAEAEAELKQSEQAE
jgi:hypothetical protein